MWGQPARAHLRSQTYLNEHGRVVWQLPWNAPLATEFIEIDRGWTPEEYRGINVPVLSIQAEFEGFFEANAATRGVPAAVLDTARAWAHDLDAAAEASRARDVSGSRTRCGDGRIRSNSSLVASPAP